MHLPLLQVQELQGHLEDLTEAFEIMMLGPQLLPLPPDSTATSASKSQPPPTAAPGLAAEGSLSDVSPIPTARDAKLSGRERGQGPEMHAAEPDIGAMLCAVIEQVCRSKYTGILIDSRFVYWEKIGARAGPSGD